MQWQPPTSSRTGATGGDHAFWAVRRCAGQSGGDAASRGGQGGAAEGGDGFWGLQRGEIPTDRGADGSRGLQRGGGKGLKGAAHVHRLAQLTGRQLHAYGIGGQFDGQTETSKCQLREEEGAGRRGGALRPDSYLSPGEGVDVLHGMSMLRELHAGGGGWDPRGAVGAILSQVGDPGGQHSEDFPAAMRGRGEEEAGAAGEEGGRHGRERDAGLAFLAREGRRYASAL